ncbi:MAG: 16S rRNA (guanine(966)-N(2))-methyltransferase RsmD [Alphaproteobacteria bacterium]|jgi:16S rRNA (guanine966-N2)-methyltransferase|nr:16S rRNA (guanine(966)-N(2))-methyltransferase RsmD [Alphaproteobacteria bacterium]MBO6627880.1 16S rRNA (guanine(966)-N(2))-methyltransferase RsmD [Alphaproteobacteria bacterium]MDF1625450.1 16S rRNA (guanine(966)-N(2))-methyltransferase RsmD [Parvibaculaceae bacterium]
MRIVGGELRGRRLLAPDDKRVRPTSDRTREALFNVLAHGDFGSFDLRGARVLDLFAGTGALGLEALSRGAAHALFVDESAASRGLIRENAETLGVTGRVKLYRRDATQLGAREGSAGPAFNLVFADPPYKKGLGEKALSSALHGGWIAPDAVVVLEEETAAEIAIPAGFVAADRRTYGITQIVILQLETLAATE